MRLFFVNTEYHLFVTLLLIEKWSLMKSEYLIIIIKSKNRFNDCELNEQPFIIINNELNIKMKKYSVYDLQVSAFYQHAEAYFFLDTEYLNCYYIRYLKNKGYRIILVQDGMNAYWIVDDFRYFKALFRNYFHYLYLHYIHGLKNLYFNVQWGGSEYVDEIYVTHPELLTQNSKIRKLDLRHSELSLKSLWAVFNFSNVKTHDREVLYISQGFVDQKQVEIEKNHVQFLSNYLLSLNKSLLVKVHPSIALINYDWFSTLSNVELIKQNYPVELLINDMRNSFIISPFSAANLYFVESNKYFWTFPLFYPKWKKNAVPSHIDIVDNFKDFLIVLDDLFIPNRRVE